MQKSKLKKGFTLVELAIVIAVIAILIAVLVPTFIALIDKAGESKDSQLVKNLNTSITIENASGDIVTMKDAIDAAKENGYDVAQITPTSDGYDILWDQETKYFLLADSEGNVVYSSGSYNNLLESGNYDTYRFWKIADSSESLSDQYSNYLAYEATSITTSTGVDVGSYSNVAITIDQNTTKPEATKTKVGTATAEKTSTGSDEKPLIMVNCDAGSLTIKTAATVIINGNITSNVEIAYAGTTVVIAEKANVPNVLVTAKDVTITNNSSVSVTVAATSTGSVKDVNGNHNGIIENVSKDTLSNFAGGFGTESSPYQIATAAQFANIVSSYSSADSHYYILTNDIELDEIKDNFSSDGYLIKYFRGVLDGDGHIIYSLTDSNASFVQYLTVSTIKNLTVHQQGGYYLNLAIQTYYVDGTVTFQNITIEGDETSFDNNESSFILFVTGTVNFINCTNSVDIKSEAGYFGIFIGGYAVYTAGYQNKISFINCINTATVTGVCVGFFTGNANQSGFYLVNNSDFSDCRTDTFKWTSSSTGNTYDGYYTAAYVEGCANKGVIIGTTTCSAFASNAGTSAITNVNASTGYINVYANSELTSAQFSKGTMILSNIAITVGINSSNGLAVTCETDETDYTIKVTYKVSVSYINSGSGYVWIVLEADDNGVAKYLTEIVDGTASSYNYNGKTYDDIDSEEYTDSYGNNYKLVQQTDGSYIAIVGYIRLSDGATSAVIGSNLEYIITVSNSENTIIGAVTEKVNTLKSISE